MLLVPPLGFNALKIFPLLTIGVVDGFSFVLKLLILLASDEGEPILVLPTPFKKEEVLLELYLSKLLELLFSLRLDKLPSGLLLLLALLCSSQSSPAEHLLFLPLLLSLSVGAVSVAVKASLLDKPKLSKEFCPLWNFSGVNTVPIGFGLYNGTTGLP